jgi:multiple antibiotic resistance protein
VFEHGLRAFTTFFATIGPVDVAALFAVLTAGATASQRRQMAFKGTGIAVLLLLAFAVLGQGILQFLGITLPALRTAGGILLLLLAIDMVFARPQTMTTPTSAEASEARQRPDISVFPLATPLIAGPAAMGAAVLLTAEAEGNLLKKAAVILALIAVMALTLAFLLVAAQLHRVLGVTGENVIARVAGIVLAGLAVQFLFDGVRASGLL